MAFASFTLSTNLKMNFIETWNVSSSTGFEPDDKCEMMSGKLL